MQALQSTFEPCSCGYEAHNERDMVDHLVRSGALSKGRRLDPSVKHQDPWFMAKPRSPAVTPYPPPEPEVEGEDDEDDDPQSLPPFQLPYIYRLAYKLAVVIGVGSILLVIAVSSFLFVPFVLDSLVAVGPLKPYARLISFFWEWGLVLLPVLVFVVLGFSIPSLRGHLIPLIRRFAAWIILLLLTVALATSTWYVTLLLLKHFLG